MPQPELWVGGRRILGGNTRYFSRILMLAGSCWCLFLCLWAPSKCSRTVPAGVFTASFSVLTVEALRNDKVLGLWRS